MLLSHFQSLRYFLRGQINRGRRTKINCLLDFITIYPDTKLVSVGVNPAAIPDNKTLFSGILDDAGGGF